MYISNVLGKELGLFKRSLVKHGAKLLTISLKVLDLPIVSQ